MGLLDTLFGRRRRQVAADRYFKMLTGYSPMWTTPSEKIYEYEIIRASIHSFASLCSKLKPEIRGSAMRQLEDTLQFRPNPFMDTSKFLYRLATILSVNNTAFVLPMENKAGELVGYYPLLPESCEVIDVGGEPFLRYNFASGERAAIELEKVGILTHHHYSEELFGDSNAALRPTLNLIHTQNQGIVAAVKNSAVVRFLGRLANVYTKDDRDKSRNQFTAENLAADNKSGIVIYDATFADVKPIESKPYTINAEQMKLINTNVYNYFGTNEKILQNSYDEEGWNAYYEGKIEPFALQLSLVMSNITFSEREIAHGNQVIFSANRLQYTSNNTKLNISTQLFDRGLVSRNDVMHIWGMPHVEGGDTHYIRKEYAKLEDLGKEWNINANNQVAGIQKNDPAAGAGVGGTHQEV